MAAKKHPLMLEAIAKAKAAALSNRGMYSFTLTTNVFKLDGSPLEEKAVENEDGVAPVEPVPEADVTVEAETAVETLATAEDGAVVEVAAGEIAQELTVEKSVTMLGENAGIAQNFDQEVQ